MVDSENPEQPTGAKRPPRRWLAGLLGLAAVGLAVIVVLASSSGGSPRGAVSYRAAGAPPTPAATHTPAHSTHTVAAAKRKPATTPAAPAKAASPTSGIPQQNGGDADPDNNGGSDDGDGQI